MYYIIKVNKQYVERVGMWTQFTWFKENAQRFVDEAEAEAAVEEMLMYGFYRNFDRADVTVIPCEK